MTSSSTSSTKVTHLNYKYGFHCVKQPTLCETVMRFTYTRITALQTYIANARSNALPTCDLVDIEKTLNLLTKHNIYFCVHAKLLHNLAGSSSLSDPDRDFKMANTRRGLVAELDVCAGLMCGAVVHIGTCEDLVVGIENVIDTIIHVLTIKTEYSKKLSNHFKIPEDEFVKRRKIILENAAGETNKIGSTLEDIAEIVNGIKRKSPNLLPQVKVCIDTAHAFGAGLCDWGIPDDVVKFYRQFDKLIGLDYLEVFHLNDSRRSEEKGKNAFFGSKKDRHENLGKGYIFGPESGVSEEILTEDEISFSQDHPRSEGLRKFFELARIHHVSVIGEPPGRTEDAATSALGGLRDWNYVDHLLRDTEYPLYI